MQKVLLVLLLSFITIASPAHLGKIDDKGGHWNHRLGAYHQHYDFETSMADPDYDWDMAKESHIDSKLRFYNVGFRTYHIDNGKHAFGFQYARQMNSEFDYGSQWGFGLNYRRRYSKNTTITYSLDYCRAGAFNVIELSGLWGIYIPQISENVSLHIGFLGSRVLESDTPLVAISTHLEYEVGVCIISVRYDMYYDMVIYGTGLTYKF